MNIRKLRIILIIVGIGVSFVGAYITNDSLNNIQQNLSYEKELNKLATSTNYSIGIVILSVGLVIFGFGIFWKRKTSK